MSAEQYGGPQESQEERERKAKSINLRVSDLFDSSKPWLLVPSGSLLGYFDWVPAKLRVGPWSPLASLYLVVIALTLVYSGYWWHNQPATPQIHQANDNEYWWYYNVIGFLWMMYVSYTVVKGPAGFNAWGTFSMWSWTMVKLRHGLAALQPIFPNSALLMNLLRYTHLPSLTMATIVTIMWNFVIGPVIYFVYMDTPVKKSKFLQYFTSFRLTQIHVFLLLYAILNSVSTLDGRVFDFGDLWGTMMVTFSYMLLYLLVLDRIGVHLYPIFSPRSHSCVLVWSAVWFLHVIIYWVWKRLLQYNVDVAR